MSASTPLNRERGKLRLAAGRHSAANHVLAIQPRGCRRHVLSSNGEDYEEQAEGAGWRAPDFPATCFSFSPSELDHEAPFSLSGQ